MIAVRRKLVHSSSPGIFLAKMRRGSFKPWDFGL
jgi:hypothetical protein